MGAGLKFENFNGRYIYISYNEITLQERNAMSKKEETPFEKIERKERKWRRFKTGVKVAYGTVALVAIVYVASFKGTHAAIDAIIREMKTEWTQPPQEKAPEE